MPQSRPPATDCARASVDSLGSIGSWFRRLQAREVGRDRDDIAVVQVRGNQSHQLALVVLPRAVLPRTDRIAQVLRRLTGEIRGGKRDAAAVGPVTISAGLQVFRFVASARQQ